MLQLIELIKQTVNLGTQACEYVNKQMETINQNPCTHIMKGGNVRRGATRDLRELQQGLD